MGTEMKWEVWGRKGRMHKMVEQREMEKTIIGRGLSIRSLNLMSLKWRRLSISPASNYESLKLELSGVGVPSSSSGPLSNDEGETTSHFVYDGDKMLKSMGGGGSDQVGFCRGICC